MELITNKYSLNLEKIAIHQPNYLPWLGYFSKLINTDIFIFLDDVQYTKNSWQNRVLIKTPQGGKKISQPIKKVNGLNTLTCDIIFADNNWKKNHLKTLALNYKKAPLFNEFFNVIEEIFFFKSNSLSEFNINAILIICEYLSIKKHYSLSSAMNIKSKSSQRLIDIIKFNNSKKYIHGKGGLSYQDKNLFMKNQIKLISNNFFTKDYKQQWGEFIEGLSIVDACFNLPKEEVIKLL